MSDTPIFDEVVARWLSEGKQVPGRGVRPTERVAPPQLQRKAAS